MKILILGGTTEASDLARRVADLGWDATISLAGRTSSPAPQPIPIRTGGFGGASGLAAFLRDQRIDLLVDATHPFATKITGNAAAAARQTGTPSIAIVRPAWMPQQGDRWHPVPDMQQAASALGDAPRRVLLTVGQKELAPFIAAPQHHYLIRSIERPAALPPGEFIAARGPFALEDERALLREHRIDAIVSKNSGGAATQPKLAAARALAIEVVMVARPPLPPGLEVVRTVPAALGWLMSHAGTFRGE